MGQRDPNIFFSLLLTTHQIISKYVFLSLGCSWDIYIKGNKLIVSMIYFKLNFTVFSWQMWNFNGTSALLYWCNEVHCIFSKFIWVSPSHLKMVHFYRHKLPIENHNGPAFRKSISTVSLKWNTHGPHFTWLWFYFDKMSHMQTVSCTSEMMTFCSLFFIRVNTCLW